MLLELLMQQQAGVLTAIHSVKEAHLRAEIQNLENQITQYKSKAEYYEQLYIYEKRMREELTAESERVVIIP